MRIEGSLLYFYLIHFLLLKIWCLGMLGDEPYIVVRDGDTLRKNIGNKINFESGVLSIR